MRIKGAWRLAVFAGRVRLAAETLRARLGERFLSWLLPRLAPLVRRIAETGVGADACLRHDCLPLKVDFYSPVPDIEDLRRRGIWERRSEMRGVDLELPGQLELLGELGERFGDECVWPHAAPEDETAFFTDNMGFSYGCAASTYCVLRQFRPRRVVEIGSGSSTRVIAQALRRNAQEDGTQPDYTVVDPYPGPAIARLPGVTRLIPERAELQGDPLIDGFEAGDVLFVDSGHTVRAGGDVNFLILDVLPRLPVGGIAHFHDIPLPYEYSSTYATDPAFRVFWTEAYLLQAFLAHNPAFQVLLGMNLLMLEHEAAFRAAFAHYDPTLHRYVSHSFWIRRRQ